MSKIDHEQLAESRLAIQFKESTNLINYIKALLVEANTLEQVFCDLLEKRWIDTASGVNLDILGTIVGQPRKVIDSSDIVYFGFSGYFLSNAFSSYNNPSLGGKFIGNNTPETGFRLLNDNEYRLFIRSRIARNSIIPTPEAIIAFTRSLLGAEQVLFHDGDTQYSIAVSKILSLNEKTFLLLNDLIPKTAGVRVNYTVNYEYDDFFSLGEVFNSKGFGSLADLSIGGKMGVTI